MLSLIFIIFSCKCIYSLVLAFNFFYFLTLLVLEKNQRKDYVLILNQYNCCKCVKRHFRRENMIVSMPQCIYIMLAFYHNFIHKLKLSTSFFYIFQTQVFILKTKKYQKLTLLMNLSLIRYFLLNKYSSLHQHVISLNFL